MKARELKAATRDPLDVLFDLDGLYECPKSPDEKRQGPLVAYAGRDEDDRQFVGDLYANFAEAEQWPDIYDAWRTRFFGELNELSIDTYMGMPMAGILVAASVVRMMPGSRLIYPDRKVVALATDKSRERSVLTFGRHSIKTPGERVALCEDVTNNFSTTHEAAELVANNGGIVVAIVTILNRSERICFKDGDHQIPVIALVQKPMPQYKQDDPAVAVDVAVGNVVWKVKPEWQRLKAIMQQHRR